MDRREGTQQLEDVEKADRERAQELEVIIPDPTALLAALDQIREKVITKDAGRKFRVDAAREALKVEILTNFESVEKFSLILVSELEEMVTTSWSIVTPKVKTVQGNPERKNGK